MPSSSHRPALLATCAVLTLAAVLATTPDAVARTHGGDTAGARAEAAWAAEGARLGTRLDSVLRELRTADIRALAPDRRAVRARRIAQLQAYRDRGAFPHNHEFQDRAIPFFVDHRGVICAVGHLLRESGREDIVDRVRAANNNVWVAELAGDTAFRAWLEGSGLTLAEAARIQAPYVGTPPNDVEVAPASNRVNTAAAIVSSGLGIASIAWNAKADGGEHRRLRAALGFTAGAAGMAVAATRMPEARGAPLAVGISSGTIGLVSAAMATRALLAGRQPARVAAPLPGADEAATVSMAPTIVASGDRMVPGFAMHVRF